MVMVDKMSSMSIWDVSFCMIDALAPSRQAPGARTKYMTDNHIKKIMAEPMPCTDCQQADGCMVECSLFQRYTNSKGKDWRDVEIFTTKRPEVIVNHKT